MRDPILSIIVPYHNRREMLEYLLGSIPDRASVEVILVDDHSTEEFTVSHGMKKTRILKRKNLPEKRFAGTARNFGMSIASGEWILFADSDDVFFKKRLEKLINHLECGDYADYDLIHTYSESFFNDGGRGTRHIMPNWHIWRLSQGDPEWSAHCLYPWGKVIRRSFVEDNHLCFDDTHASEDVMFSVGLFLAGPRTTVFEQVVYRVRQGNPGSTTDLSEFTTLVRLDVLRRMNDRFISKNKSSLCIPAWVHLKNLPWGWDRLRQVVLSMSRGHPLLITRRWAVRYVLFRMDRKNNKFPI